MAITLFFSLPFFSNLSRRSAVCVFAAALFGVAANPAMAQLSGVSHDVAAYISAAADIPLAPGLQESATGALIFDKPEGRIVQVTAVDTIRQPSPQVIYRFYTQALPNLGWHQKQGDDKPGASDGLTFVRENEILRVLVADDLVIFDITPATSGMPAILAK